MWTQINMYAVRRKPGFGVEEGRPVCGRCIRNSMLRMIQDKNIIAIRTDAHTQFYAVRGISDAFNAAGGKKNFRQDIRTGLFEEGA